MPGQALKQAIKIAIEYDGPVYIRVARDNVPNVEFETSAQMGKSNIVEDFGNDFGTEAEAEPEAEEPSGFTDEEFARWGVKHNMIWNDSNLFIDEKIFKLAHRILVDFNTDMGRQSG